MLLIHLLEDPLPMDPASRMQRARELGFVIRAYHGTGATFQAFDLNKGKANSVMGYAPHFADQKSEASGYAKERAGKGKSRTLQVLLRVHHPFIVDLNGPKRFISQEEYQQLVGHPYEDKFEAEPRTSRTLSDMEYSTARQPGMEFSREDKSNRRRWTDIYRLNQGNPKVQPQFRIPSGTPL